MGTPLLTRVPRVRVNREMATLLTTGPRIGKFNLNLSNRRRPNFVRVNSFKATKNPTTEPKAIRKCPATNRLTLRTNWVKAGSPCPSSISLKIASNFGMTKTMRMVRMVAATKTTAHG